MNVLELQEKMVKIASDGYIETNRSGSTGVGKLWRICWVLKRTIEEVLILRTLV